MRIHPLMTCVKRDPSPAPDSDSQLDTELRTTPPTVNYPHPDTVSRTTNEQDIIGENIFTPSGDKAVASSELVKVTAHVEVSGGSYPAGLLYDYPDDTRTQWDLWPGLAAHNHQDTPGHADVSGPHFSNIMKRRQSYHSDDSEAAEASKVFCWGICCLQGCIYGVFGMVYFFVFLPSGFLFIFYGKNQNHTWAIIVGGVIIVTSTFAIPCLCVLFRWYRGHKKDNRKAYREARNRAVAKETYINPSVIASVQETEVT